MPDSMAANLIPGKSLEHAGAAQICDRLDSRDERMRNVVDDGAAVFARRARIASSRDVERDRQIGCLDHRPHRIENRQIVVWMTRVMRAEDRLARQSEAAEAQLRDALDFLDRALEVGRRDRRHRRHAVVVLREGLPRPVVVDADLRVRKVGVGRGPHRKTLVRKNNFRIDAVANLIFAAALRDRRRPCERRWSSPSRRLSSRRERAHPSEIAHLTPFSSTSTRGSLLRYL